MREIIQPPLFLGIKVIHISDRILDRLRVQGILVFDVLEIGMALPERVGKALVPRQNIGRLVKLCTIAAQHQLLGVHEVAHRLAPIFQLLFINLAGIFDHLGPIRTGGLGKQILRGRAQGRIGRGARRQSLNQRRSLALPFILFPFNSFCYAAYR
jgi:hypothetical protein